jgi:hypothetical protein
MAQDRACLSSSAAPEGGAFRIADPHSRGRFPAGAIKTVLATNTPFGPLKHPISATLGGQSERDFRGEKGNIHAEH